MKIFKVIKAFAEAKKGDVFEETSEGIFTMERIDIDKNGSSYKSWVSMELTEPIIESLVNDGYLLDMTPGKSEGDITKIKELEEYVDNLISTYTTDYSNLKEAYENGDVQPCVKVEAETVYHNLIKVLNSIKDKINE